jgi:hypothetical protein
MKAWEGIRLGTLGLALAAAVGCDYQSTVPVVASDGRTSANGERLPFDREGRQDGISPTSSVIPPGAQIPAGTPVTIRLKSAVSSATAVSNDEFEAVLEEPIIVNEQVVVERGTLVEGRVLDARARRQMRTPGYLRLALSSIAVQGKRTPLRTSSAFLKGAGSGRKHMPIPGGTDGTLIGAVSGGKTPMLGNAMVVDGPATPSVISTPRDVTVDPERRLTFRLLEAIPLHP